MLVVTATVTAAAATETTDVAATTTVLLSNTNFVWALRTIDLCPVGFSLVYKGLMDPQDPSVNHCYSHSGGQLGLRTGLLAHVIL